VAATTRLVCHHRQVTVGACELSPRIRPEFFGWTKSAVTGGTHVTMKRSFLLVCASLAVACGDDAERPLAGAAGAATAGAAGQLTSNGGTGSAGSAGASSGGASAGAPGGGMPAVLGGNESYEAEEAFHAGTATFVASTADVSGGGSVDALGGPDAKLIFAVNVASAGQALVRLRFRNPGAAKNVTIHVNGSNVAGTTLASSEAFVEHAQMLTLRAGLNTIAFLNDSGSEPKLSVDRLDLANGAPRPARGAIVPFSEYEAESGSVQGTTIGPDTQVGTLAANASGRRAVTLGADGDYVEWSTTSASNAVALRYSLPDAPGGGGLSAKVALFVDGQKRQDLELSSKNAWVYDPYPFGNDPASGVASRLFSEERYLVGDIPSGAQLRLQREAGSTQPVTIDLLDAELVPEAYAQPPGSVSIIDHGAVPNDDADDSSALLAAIAAAKASSKLVWIPAGVFVLAARVDLDHVTVRGAGPWHSVLRGKNNQGGFNGTGDAIQLLDFAIFGDMDHRDDSFHAGVDGSFGKGSLIQNLWIQSTKVGIWLINTTGAYVVGTRIRDTYADGVNLNIDATQTAVEHVHVRNTGDDGLAIWAKGSSGHNRFKLCTVHAPYHASAIALYGGDGNSVEDCEVADTIRNGAGIQVGTRHDPVPLAGTTSVVRNTIARAGSFDVPNNDQCFGALWLFADTKDIDAPLAVRELDIADSTCNAIHFMGSHAVKQVLLDSVRVENAAGTGLKIETTGSGIFNAVSVTGAVEAANIAPAFTATRGAGNSGW
jgi:hypothetical protein